MAMTLPEELAPSLRAAAEQLIAECGEADTDDCEFEEMLGAVAEACWVCKQTTGPKGGHHLDDGRVVKVHRKCHVKLHRGKKHLEQSLREQRAAFGLRQIGAAK